MTGTELQASEFRQTLHLKLGRGGYGYDFACVADPRVEIHIRRATARDPQRTTLHVGDRLFERGQWSAAAQALNEMGKADA